MDRLVKKMIVFHAVAASQRETLQHQGLPLLHSSEFQCCNQKEEEVQEHKFLSACQRTIVSLRPRTRIRTRKR